MNTRLKRNNSSIIALYAAKTELENLLILSCLFSLCLTGFRIFYTKQWLFAWMGWNLFLALVPYLLTRTAIRRPAWIENNRLFAILFTVWLVFLPNSFYIITDLFHLENRKAVPFWYDLALIFSFAWNGILLGVASLRQMESFIQSKWPQVKEWQFVYPIMALNAFGVYIGRYLRYNSWDVVTNFFQFTADMASLAMHPLNNRFEWSMILCYTALLSLVYLALKRAGKVL